MTLRAKIVAPYKGFAEIISRYWRAYGGAPGVIFSPYAHLAILLTAILWPLWARGAWWETALTVVPSVLGFTLAGFTIWLGFGDERFQRLMASKRPGKSTSPYIGVSAAFVHFIIVQFLAVIAAVVAKATAFDLEAGSYFRGLMDLVAPFGHFIGFLLFSYALMTALAATLGVFRVASMFEGMSAKSQERRDGPSPRPRSDTAQ